MLEVSGKISRFHAICRRCWPYEEAYPLSPMRRLPCGTKKDAAGAAVEDVFADLRQDGSGQLGVDASDEQGRDHSAGHHGIGRGGRMKGTARTRTRTGCLSITSALLSRLSCTGADLKRVGRTMKGGDHLWRLEGSKIFVGGPLLVAARVFGNRRRLRGDSLRLRHYEHGGHERRRGGVGQGLGSQVLGTRSIASALGGIVGLGEQGGCLV